MRKLFSAENFAAASVIIPILIFAFSGCPSFEPASELSDSNLKIYSGETGGGNETVSAVIEEGQTLIFKADTGVSSALVSVVWELDNEKAAIVSSGTGAACSVRGIETGAAVLTVKAWRNSGGTPVIKTVAITVTESQIKDVILTAPLLIGEGEERRLEFEISPFWARNIPVTWSTSGSLVSISANGTVKGLSAGSAVITAAAGAFSKTFNIEVKSSDTITGLSIRNGLIDVTDSNILIGLFEEINLAAAIEPANAYTWFNWSSGNPANVSVNPLTGTIKGLKADTTAVITVTAGTETKQVTVSVKNPVTGIRVIYNDSKMPVSNVIWLSSGESVTLAVELAPHGIAGTVSWTYGESVLGINDEVIFADSGLLCTLTGGSITRFDMLPSELHITAGNDDNEKPVTTVVLVKTQEPPIWAWDRSRDISPNMQESIRMGDVQTCTITGRGQAITEMPFQLGGNEIKYTTSGIWLNSSNNSSGLNPYPALPPLFYNGNPGNSTRIYLGTTNRAATTAINSRRGGVFDILEIGGIIRISVDYEIVWTAGAGRNMWILVNNNEANATRSELGTNSQLLINPLIDPRGTRRTAVASLNVDDFVSRNVPGVDTLNEAFFSIICLSNGGSVYISGIRIEKED